MLNRSIWVLLFLGVFALTWFFNQNELTDENSDSLVATISSDENTTAKKTVAVGSVSAEGEAASPTNKDAKASFSTANLEARLTPIGDTSGGQPVSHVKIEPRGVQAGNTVSNQDTTSGHALTTLGKRLTETAIVAEKLNQKNAVSEATEENSVEVTNTKYEVRFSRSPSEAIGAIDVVLNWDANKLSVVNAKAVCIDKSGASLFQQGLVTPSSVRFALLYPAGISNQTTLLSCEFKVSDAVASGQVPSLSGEVFSVQGKVITDASAILQIAL